MLKRAPILVMVLLAGCAQSIPIETQDGNSPLADPMLEACKATESASEYLPGQNPGHFPSTWNATFEPESSIIVILLQCQHVSWGPFERGPISFVIEVNSIGEVPLPCRFGHPDLGYQLDSWMTDDAELAVYLRDVHGMPATKGTVELQVKNLQGVDSFIWRWNATGFSSSMLEDQNLGQIGNQAMDLERLFWENGTGLDVIDLQIAKESGEPQVLQNGQMQSPMLYSQAYPGVPYVGTGVSFQHYDATGTLYQFKDQLCQEPA